MFRLRKNSVVDRTVPGFHPLFPWLWRFSHLIPARIFPQMVDTGLFLFLKTTKTF
ncbi:MAG: hypothetical protein H6581_00650 [Bacteroidia bacterium]|nr:hypothetical protein [Bacteroidia bacterium]